MKIDKIKDFNQIILFIAGILGLILLLFISVSTISDIIRTWNFGSNNTPTITNSLISEDEAVSLKQENKRLQIISYNSPKLIDTPNTVYIIPISVSTLDKPETVVEAASKGSLGLLDANVTAEKKGYYERNYFEGLFANLIVYRPIEDKASLLFKERIMLGGLRTYNFKDDILLVFFTAEKDNNGDGLINFSDDANLCIYSLKSDKIQRITSETNSITDYHFIEDSKDLIVEISLSQYNNVKFKSYKPQKIMKYNFGTGKLTEVVPAQIQQQMQNLVEGKKVQ